MQVKSLISRKPARFRVEPARTKSNRIKPNQTKQAPMKEHTETLAELMLHADRFCSKVEAATQDVAPNPEEKELRTKIGQCRNQLAYLQEVFNEGKLRIENPRVRAEFRQLVMALLWIAFYARSAIDFRIFRMLVRIESGFTYLLVSR
jgi:hypothetical protein